VSAIKAGAVALSLTVEAARPPINRATITVALMYAQRSATLLADIAEGKLTIFLPSVMGRKKRQYSAELATYMGTVQDE
jgi:hypothetical protein